jgi:hypothetical protein
MKLLYALALLVVASPSWAATCWVTELASLRKDGDANTVQVADFGKNQAAGTAVTTQAVTSVDATTQSAAFGAGTQMIRVYCDAQVYFSIALNPTATTSTPPLAATTAEYFGVPAGWKIAFCDADCA